MANKKTFEDRIDDAKVYVEKGEIAKAISTLNKAIDNYPNKDIDGKVKIWINELEQIEEKPEETLNDAKTTTEVKIEDNGKNHVKKVISAHKGNIGVYTKNPNGVCIMGKILLPGEVREFKVSFKEGLSTIPDILIHGE